MDSAGLGKPDTAWPGGRGPSLFLRGRPPSSPQAVCPCPGLGRGEGNFVGNKLHSVDFAAELFASPRKVQPWEPNFVPPSPCFTALGLSKLHNGVRPALTGRGHLGADSTFAPGLPG